MLKSATRLAAAIALGALTAGAAMANTVQRPPDSVTALIYTSPEGCTYTRAQAPGYPPSWHIVLNPQRLGLPRPAGRCPTTL